MSVFFIILGVIFVFATIAYFIFMKEPKAIVGAIGAILALVLIIVGASIVVIPTGYTGVKSTFGQVDPDPVPQGFSFKAPFITHVEKVNNKQQDYAISSETKIWGETKSRTAIAYSGVTITATINPEYSAWMVANISNYEDVLITEAVISSAIKTASKGLTDEEATNRDTMERLTKDLIQESLNDKFDKELVFIDKVSILNADFEESYNTAIAEKQKAQLAYEQQQIENKKAIEKAQADAEVKKVQAQGKAEAAIIAAEGEKKANELLEQSLTNKVIENKKVEKWNGVLPQVSGDSGVMIDFTQSNK